jgi:hypothetical protein
MIILVTTSEPKGTEESKQYEGETHSAKAQNTLTDLSDTSTPTASDLLLRQTTGEVARAGRTLCEVSSHHWPGGGRTPKKGEDPP